MRLNNWLPRFDFKEYHEITIDAAPSKVYPVLKEIDFMDSKIIRILFRLRGLGVKRGTLTDFIDMGFIFLEEQEGGEIVLGFLGGAGGFMNVTASKFKQVGEGDEKKGILKGAWNFAVTELPGNKTRLSTETRVQCTSRLTKISFSIYWFFIAPFSRWIRRIILRMVKRKVIRTNS